MRIRHVLDALAVYRLRGKADEIDRMSELECVADLADRFEATDTWSLAGARVDDDYRPFAFVELDAAGGRNGPARS